ncbi:hypothetical protein cypCar_00031687 [Cyprinus carpio]|nr:hypothetical protein cypCar_00031687 [Cyprinus carpio]
MDLRVGERLVRPGSDTAFLSPLHPPLLIGPFNPQHCSQYSQQQLQRIQPYNMEQHLRDQELAKKQLQQLKNKDKSQQSAVASALVKQKLAQVILKKQKAVLERTSSNPLSSPSVAYRLETALITAHSCSSAHVHRLMRFSSDFKIKVFCVSSGSWFQIPALLYSRSCPPQIHLSAKGPTIHP